MSLTPSTKKLRRMTMTRIAAVWTTILFSIAMLSLCGCNAVAAAKCPAGYSKVNGKCVKPTPPPPPPPIPTTKTCPGGEVIPVANECPSWQATSLQNSKNVLIIKECDSWGDPYRHVIIGQIYEVIPHKMPDLTLQVGADGWTGEPGQHTLERIYAVKPIGTIDPLDNFYLLESCVTGAIYK
jgi:hypothetical protein